MHAFANFGRIISFNHDEDENIDDDESWCNLAYCSTVSKQDFWMLHKEHGSAKSASSRKHPVEHYIFLPEKTRETAQGALETGNKYFPLHLNKKIRRLFPNQDHCNALP